MKLKILTIISLLNLISILAISQDSYMVESEIDGIKLNGTQILNSKKIFSLDKFSLGVYGGVNFSLIIPYQRNSIFSGQVTTDFDKKYNFFIENFGSQMGFIFMYNISKLMKISIQPSSNNYTYKYKNSYQWTGNTILQYQTQYAHHLRIFEVPLIAGFYMSYKTWQPYFQGGIFYGRLLNATADISLVETSSNLAGSSQSLNYSTSSSSTDLYKKNQYGISGGAGLDYLIGKTRIGIDANYKLLLSNLNTTETQYVNNQVVSGTYDVPDKFKFSNLSINIHIIVPIKCDSSGGRGGALFCE